MKIVKTVDRLKEEINKVRKQGKKVGFVPTMGFLHDGHLELVRQCNRQCDFTVVSIFVNRRQFGPGEDFERYPRDLRRDSTMLANVGCDLIFAPSEAEIYPPGYRTKVSVEGLKEKLCGASRPGHFDGVCTVVLKLLLAVMPDVAFFGEKDYQQLVIIRKMVSDLELGVKIIGVPTVRERDGLAMSSRNTYLNENERKIATCLYKSLEMAKLMIAGGEKRSRAITDAMTQIMLSSGVSKIDYISIVDTQSLEDVRYVDRKVRIAVAAWVGSARLIDNIEVDPDLYRYRKHRGKGVVCIILAAGEGKRMKSKKPKVLHKICGKTMLEYVVTAAREAGLRELVAIIGHYAHQVEPLVRKLGADVIVQEVQRGTGHAVLQAYPLLSDFDGDVVVLSGDTPLLRGKTVRHLLEIHRKHSNTVTFATAIVPDSTGYGRILRDSEGGFLRIVEEKDASEDHRKIKEVNAGIYCFRARPLLDALLMVDADNAQMEYYLPDALGRIASRGGRIEGFVIDDYTEALGVNTQEELRRIGKILRMRKRNENT
ncbi:MAG: pantoate--beta-alanine ligase [bacterium]